MGVGPGLIVIMFWCLESDEGIASDSFFSNMSIKLYIIYDFKNFKTFVNKCVYEYNLQYVWGKWTLIYIQNHMICLLIDCLQKVYAFSLWLHYKKKTWKVCWYHEVQLRYPGLVVMMLWLLNMRVIRFQMNIE